MVALRTHRRNTPRTDEYDGVDSCPRNQTKALKDNSSQPQGLFNARNLRRICTRGSYVEALGSNLGLPWEVIVHAITWCRLTADTARTACVEIVGDDQAMQVLNLVTAVGIPASRRCGTGSMSRW
jgi:hypothetical protein